MKGWIENLKPARSASSYTQSQSEGGLSTWSPILGSFRSKSGGTPCQTHIRLKSFRFNMESWVLGPTLLCSTISKWKAKGKSGKGNAKREDKWINKGYQGKSIWEWRKKDEEMRQQENTFKSTSRNCDTDDKGEFLIPRSCSEDREKKREWKGLAIV